MKIYITCFLFLLMNISGKSQDSTILLSRFEDFINKPESIIKTEIVLTGQYGGHKVFKYSATDLSTGMHTFAVRVDDNYNLDFPPALTDPKAVYIDSADLDKFIATAQSFLKVTEVAHYASNTILNYFTSTNVQLACYYTRYSDDWSFEIDKVYQKLRTHIPETAVVLNKKRMQEFVNLLKQAQMDH